jgi:hypothetical protein
MCFITLYVSFSFLYVYHFCVPMRATLAPVALTRPDSVRTL